LLNASPCGLTLTLPSYQTHLLVSGLSCLVLGMASSLDAFRAYPMARGYPACLQTTGALEAPIPRSSRTQGTFPSGSKTLLEDATEMSRDVLNPTNVGF